MNLDRVASVATEWLLQKDAETRARARESNPEHARLVQLCLRGADERLDLLGDVTEPVVALASSAALREATLLLLEATGSRSGPLDAVAELRRTCEELAVPAGTCSAAARLLVDDPLALSGLASADLVRSALALEHVARALRAHLDGRTASRIVRSRRLRVALLAALALYGVFALGLAVFGRKNIARGKPVLMSSVDGASAPPQMLVDGVRSADTKPGSPKPDVVYTRHEAHPWALVDLGREYNIREVRLYNRDDGGFDDGLPYIVEFSFDGHTFWEVGRCETHFGSWWIDPPCRVPCDRRTTRFVRVSATGYLALSEIEVFP